MINEDLQDTCERFAYERDLARDECDALKARLTELHTLRAERDGWMRRAFNRGRMITRLRVERDALRNAQTPRAALRAERDALRNTNGDVARLYLQHVKVTRDWGAYRLAASIIGHDSARSTWRFWKTFLTSQDAIAFAEDRGWEIDRTKGIFAE
jgi:hypothetical protein